ncbi:PREDICTED: WD repeat-containing protein on Y chromosome-like [Habropoda laboriosa]|uniref:WD repeat-containing protein on Y chromosome-like n=1 Tax=Habropoda laboriosa TaxID=597456 RepID=UPI00083D603E|nr:PREDICTED: WD repeat-containing protein on Y chromosome-like [Habropoda laboriosa]
MENTETIDKNDQWSNDPNVSDLNDTRNEVSSALIYGNGLKPPILGSSYRVPDIPTKYIEPTVLDTSLPYIPVYTHLKMYDLKPIKRTSTPPLLSELRLKYQ